jgi:hypothetical protein
VRKIDLRRSSRRFVQDVPRPESEATFPDHALGAVHPMLYLSIR